MLINRWRLARLATIALILAAALWLRFSGLGWGLRHPPHTDEQVYVRNVVEMLEAGDLDHRFYTYPGGFFYLLAGPIAAVGPSRWNGPAAYLVSRGVVAAIGVLNVALIYVVGRRLVGTAAGLMAGALLAVSPVDIETCHQVRPDILLQAFGFAALLAFRSLQSLRDYVAAGALIGAATATKFTGLLLWPYLLTAHCLSRARRWTGLLAAAGVTVLVPLLLTPYALIHASQYRSGPSAQLKMYYQGQALGRFRDNLVYYVDHMARTLGPVAALLAVVGILICLRRKDRTAWYASLVHPIGLLLVMSTALLVFPRLMIPAMGVVYLLAAMPVQTVQAWRSPMGSFLALAVAAAGLYVPATRSLAYVRTVSSPSAEDRALDWIEANVFPGARILETRMDANPGARPGAALGVDNVRFEFVQRTRPEDRRWLPLVIPEMDYVITGPGSGQAWAGLVTPVFQARRISGAIALQIQRTRPDVRARYAILDLQRARITASAEAAVLPHLVDGDAATVWSTKSPMNGTEWLQIEWAAPRSVGFVEMVVGATPERHGPSVEVWVTEDGRGYRPVQREIDAGPTMQEQVLARRMGSSRPLVQRLVVRDTKPVRGLRLRQRGARDDPWAVGELRVGAR